MYICLYFWQFGLFTFLGLSPRSHRVWWMGLVLLYSPGSTLLLPLSLSFQLRRDQKRVGLNRSPGHRGFFSYRLKGAFPFRVDSQVSQSATPLLWVRSINAIIGKLNFYKLIPYLTDSGVPPNRPRFFSTCLGTF